MALTGFEDDTVHLLLAGGVVASILGLVGYATVHNKRHLIEGYIFDDLRGNYYDTDNALIDLLPGYGPLMTKLTEERARDKRFLLSSAD